MVFADKPSEQLQLVCSDRRPEGPAEERRMAQETENRGLATEIEEGQLIPYTEEIRPGELERKIEERRQAQDIRDRQGIKAGRLARPAEEVRELNAPKSGSQTK